MNMYHVGIGLLMLAVTYWMVGRKLKPFVVAAIALLLVGSLALRPGIVAAASVSKTFTDHSEASDVLLVYGGESFTYSVSGTFVGVVKLQRSLNAKSWENFLVIPSSFSTSPALTGTIQADAGKGQRVYYRVYASTHTSGSIVTALVDVNDLVSESVNHKGAPNLQLYDDGVVVPGTFGVTGVLSANGGSSAIGSARVSSNTTSGFPSGWLGTHASKPSDHKAGDMYYDSTQEGIALSTCTTATTSCWIKTATDINVWTTY